MLRSIQSLWSSLGSYAEMRPDFRLRTALSRSLHARRTVLTVEEWVEQFWQPRGIPQSLARFVYDHLSDYSGLTWGLTLPGDRLQEDLHLPLVCWFDWELCFCDDLAQELGIQIESPALLLDEAVTVEDFLVLLHQQMLQTA
jgi:hypothetical protein